MRIIPAIDIINGKCVRLTKGDYTTQKVYNEHPLEVAKMFEDHGIRYLHLVDLDGARSRQTVHYRTLETLAMKTSLAIDFGGGIRSVQDVETALNAGARQVTAGTIAIQHPDSVLSWLRRFGPEKIILGADCKNRRIATSGWTEDNGPDVVDFIREYNKSGAIFSIVTDIDKDGMLAGPSLGLYREIISQTGISLIASGGVATIEDLTHLKNTGCEGAIIGKAIYERTITLQQLSELC